MNFESREPMSEVAEAGGFSPLTPALSPLRGEGVATDTCRGPSLNCRNRRSINCCGPKLIARPAGCTL